MADKLKPHQYAALVAELKRPEHDGKTADEVFASFQLDHEQRAPAALKRLTLTRFMTEADLAAMRPKDRERLESRQEQGQIVICVVLEEMLADYPARESLPNREGKKEPMQRDVPGFPNKVRRAWFDAAWEEARP